MRKFHPIICIAFVLASALNGNANAGWTLYDMTRTLNEPHPLAGQMGTRWQPVVPAVPSVMFRTQIDSSSASPQVSPTTMPVAQPVSVSRTAGHTVVPKVPDTTVASGRSKNTSAVWRLEYANEDRSFLTNIFEPIFDPIFGGSPTDGGLTWGLRVSYTPNSSNPDWFQGVRPYLFWIDPKATVRDSYSVEQDALTASALAKREGRTVRPHVGYLAFNARLAAQRKLASRWQQIDNIDLAAGLVGPASGARVVHDFLHELIGEETDAWEQIKSEPFLNLNYEYSHRLFLFEPSIIPNFEFHPYAGVALGNALTYGSLGLNLRFGSNLFRDLGAPRQRVLLSGENFVDPGDYWAWNVFLGMEGRAIAHSVFLDGNAFQNSLSVDKNNFVYDVQLGLEGGYGAYRLSFMNVYRSREFKGQQFTTEFLRLAASAAF